MEWQQHGIKLKAAAHIRYQEDIHYCGSGENEPAAQEAVGAPSLEHPLLRPGWMGV